MSRGVHLFSSNVPGYGLSEGRCLPRSGFKIPLSKKLVYGSKRTSLVCNASSSNPRKNPDFSSQNKQRNGFSRSKNMQNQEEDRSDEETEILSSKDGPLLSLSGSSKFQATAKPGPREKEIVELFRKVQAQLRERAAIKEEKRIEALQGQGERGTVDSLLKLLRKHSAKQGKKIESEDFNLDQPESNNSINGEKNSNFFDSNSLAAEEIQEQPNVAPYTRPASKFLRKHSAKQGKRNDSEDFNLDQPGSNNSINGQKNSNFLDSNSLAPEEIQEQPSVAPYTRPASKFRRKSPVPRVKYQPILFTEKDIGLSSPSKSQGKERKNIVQLDPEPVSSDLHDEGFVQLDAESSDVDEAYDEVVEEPSLPVEHTVISSLKLSELRVLAKSRGVKGYSKLKKAELVELLS
ncbi:rho-N domain-containing protein 1, chloroplastic-like [Tasmannia lanceolata]|uniref:rho-N domain-containing protein 1, chloroplastic-like n=1 Tax=Tasmannia lanceolata TaxID=3420 RepID=UPI004064B4C0